MPRYFITTADSFVAHDDEGVEVSDRAALEAMLRRTLADILHDEGRNNEQNEFWAEATDADGRSVLKLKVALTKEAS